MLICSYSATRVDRSNLSPKIIKREKLLNEKLKDIRQYIVKNSNNLELRMLPFRNHNQHVVLFVDVNKAKKDIKLVGGIYYGRRNMSRKVTPIHVQDEDDLKELFCVFINYWERACMDDNIDFIKEAVVNNNVTDDIKSLHPCPEINHLMKLNLKLLQLLLMIKLKSNKYSTKFLHSFNFKNKL